MPNLRSMATNARAKSFELRMAAGRALSPAVPSPPELSPASDAAEPASTVVPGRWADPEEEAEEAGVHPATDADGHDTEGELIALLQQMLFDSQMRESALAAEHESAVSDLQSQLAALTDSESKAAALRSELGMGAEEWQTFNIGGRVAKITGVGEPSGFIDDEDEISPLSMIIPKDPYQAFEVLNLTTTASDVEVISYYESLMVSEPDNSLKLRGALYSIASRRHTASGNTSSSLFQYLVGLTSSEVENYLSELSNSSTFASYDPISLDVIVARQVANERDKSARAEARLAKLLKDTDAKMTELGRVKVRLSDVELALDRTKNSRAAILLQELDKMAEEKKQLLAQVAQLEAERADKPPVGSEEGNAKSERTIKALQNEVVALQALVAAKDEARRAAEVLATAQRADHQKDSAQLEGRLHMLHAEKYALELTIDQVSESWENKLDDQREDMDRELQEARLVTSENGKAIDTKHAKALDVVRREAAVTEARLVQELSLAQQKLRDLAGDLAPATSNGSKSDSQAKRVCIKLAGQIKALTAELAIKTNEHAEWIVKFANYDAES